MYEFQRIRNEKTKKNKNWKICNFDKTKKQRERRKKREECQKNWVNERSLQNKNKKTCAARGGYIYKRVGNNAWRRKDAWQRRTCNFIQKESNALLPLVPPQVGENGEDSSRVGEKKVRVEKMGEDCIARVFSLFDSLLLYKYVSYTNFLGLFRLISKCFAL